MSAWLNRVLKRRALLRGAIILPLGVVIAACDTGEDAASATPLTATTAPSPSATAEAPATASTPAVAPTQGVMLEATPACGDEDDDPTPAQTEGPYFTPNSPQRVNLRESDTAGTRLHIEGFVLSTDCTPVAGALIDLWQCDATGVYDNAGYRLRGHQFTEASGVWRAETIVPGEYPGRTRHIHVKVQAPGRSVLTTQIYFGGDAGNAADRIFDARLVLRDWQESGGAASARFDFVLNLA
ncbi:MAG: intradiol ring-cleavage dioxygenase [Chloroflexi bacterium]|nr:intradiol ring-cleavage dioxygenase [Chloroflexota bacterium]MDA1240735.1 intradiol ring-cleavage dioxygenase [Chloroflexota bacterium]